MIGNLTNSPITAAFVVFLLTANKYFRNLMCNFSQGISNIVLNKLNESFLILADALFIVHVYISLPYNKTGLSCDQISAKQYQHSDAGHQNVYLS